ncbi:uncharacterized protein LOC104859683 [Fukomys damarensis]|uniref:uncharacterized protein LOC104859683 n=1 Tax=Fukomys damarensis TaxID=885580 RepID=UPI00053FD360|nr:uncharacterized protein LOC104859683 [Fukomys damarensis]
MHVCDARQFWSASCVCGLPEFSTQCERITPISESDTEFQKQFCSCPKIYPQLLEELSIEHAQPPLVPQSLLSLCQVLQPTGPWRLGNSNQDKSSVICISQLSLQFCETMCLLAIRLTTLKAASQLKPGLLSCLRFPVTSNHSLLQRGQLSDSALEEMSEKCTVPRHFSLVLGSEHRLADLPGFLQNFSGFNIKHLTLGKPFDRIQEVLVCSEE